MDTFKTVSYDSVAYDLPQVKQLANEFFSNATDEQQVAYCQMLHSAFCDIKTVSRAIPVSDDLRKVLDAITATLDNLL